MIMCTFTMASCAPESHLTVPPAPSTPTVPDNNEKKEIIVDVMSEYYGAKGDGTTSDRAVIQLAIDDVAAAGGGTVLLPAGHTFLSGNLIMRSNVHLKFGDGAILLQNPDPSDYIEVRGYDYGEGFVKIGEPYKPIVGLQLLPYGDGAIWPESTGKWRECWYWNYPLIYADKGTHDIKISGNGTIQSMTFNIQDTSKNIYMHLIGFYGVKNVVVSGITMNHESSHCINFVSCNNGIVHNIKTWTPAATTNNMGTAASICDGLKLFNCQDFLITESIFASGDDSMMLLSTYGDVRLDRWASSTDVQPTKNIEISNCTMPSYFKGLGFCTLGMMSPDLSNVEMTDIYVHHNNFCSVGRWEGFGWLNMPDDTPCTGYYIPMKNLRWEKNNYEYWPGTYNYSPGDSNIQAGMQKYPISDQISDDPRLHSMTKMMNSDFEYAGIGYWIDVTNNGSVAEVRDEKGNHYGYLGELGKGDARLYEGVYLEAGNYTLKAKVKTGDGAKAFLEVTDQKNASVASEECTAGEWTVVALTFDIEAAGNYRLGIRGNTSGCVMADNFELVRNP